MRTLADKYEITVFKDGKKNKGWCGHVIERYLGLPLNSTRAPNFGSWELKTISLKYLRDSSLNIKETMAITMIDPYHIERTSFEDSHLLLKLTKMLIVSRIWYSINEPKSYLHGVYIFDLNDRELLEQIKNDYDLVRKTIINNGFNALTGKMGVQVQPRTKGAGHGSASRAFYARTILLKKIIHLK